MLTLPWKPIILFEKHEKQKLNNYWNIMFLFIVHLYLNKKFLKIKYKKRINLLFQTSWRCKKTSTKLFLLNCTKNMATDEFLSLSLLLSEFLSFLSNTRIGKWKKKLDLNKYFKNNRDNKRRKGKVGGPKSTSYYEFEISHGVSFCFTLWSSFILFYFILFFLNKF
jgi:hypothetical protein